MILLIVSNVKVLFLGIYSFLSTVIILFILMHSKSRSTRWWSPLIWLLLINSFTSELKLSFSEIQSSLLSLIIGALLRVTNFMSRKIHFCNWNIGKSLLSWPIIEILLFRLDHLWRIFGNCNIAADEILLIGSNVIGSFSS